MPTRRLVVAAAIALMSLSLPGLAQPARAATTWNYPADCGPTVQDCVNGAADGDAIHLFQDNAGASVSFAKSLTLASGNGTRYNAGSIGIADASATVQAIVDGLSATPYINVYFNSAANSSAVIRNVAVTGANGYASTISFDGEITSSFTLERSAVTGATGSALGLLAVPNGGQISMRVVGNQFNAHGNAQSGPGIQLTTFSSGTITADIFNNTVWDVGRGLSGAASGIAIVPSGTVHADVNVVGNTIELSATDGLQQRNSLASGGVLALDLFNNIFAHAAYHGINLTAGAPGTVVLRAGYNDTFANGSGNFYNGLPKGVGNTTVGPRFVARATGDLRLKSSSGLINIGQVCSPGGVANPDAAGMNRLFGPSVDIGALERNAGAVTGVILLGGAGPDTLAGGGGDDILCGYAGTDNLIGTGGADYLDGGADADEIYGGSGPDRLYGRGGADIICAADGVGGNDYLNGNNGNDGFQADSGDTKVSVEHAGFC